MAMDSTLVVGIDLGTTNSEIAAFSDGQVRIIGKGNAEMLPSCVGVTPGGELLIGETARNQQLVYPERTVRGIKRKMGSDIQVLLGGKTFSPQEISALILRELTAWANLKLGVPIGKAVITVPAYFSDAQRQATREAGGMAGLEILRILNEPTAASLAYGFGATERQTVLVYDLGGGTFDVSIVTIEGDVTEVLASHGNNQLGGDDFDELLLTRLLDEFETKHGLNLRNGHPVAYSRLWWAAEECKKRLSFEPYAKVREEALVDMNGAPVHFETEISRHEYESLIQSLVETTFESVARAMDDAGKRPRDLDAVLLVGGSTRTPLVRQMLQQRTGLEPRQDVHPDLCVALGAGVLASRLGGQEVPRVLVDVSPYSFGISYLGPRGGYPYPYCYHPIISRNTPLPVTRADSYTTSQPFQTAVSIEIYQGEDEDALKNIPVGHFIVDGLKPTEELNVVMCKMSLDLDGILHVSAIEKATGKAKHITIDNAMQPKSEEEIDAARQRLEALFSARLPYLEADDFDGEEEGGEDEEENQTDDDEAGEPAEGGFAANALLDEARGVVERSRKLLEKMHSDDREEAIGFHEAIQDAIEKRDIEHLSAALASLKELLFFVEGH